MNANKTPEDVESLIEIFSENLDNPMVVRRSPNPYELRRVQFDEGQLCVLYKTGTALIQGTGNKSDIAAICRAEGWECKG